MNNSKEKISKHSDQFHKIIEVNVIDESRSSSSYNQYLNELINKENNLKINRMKQAHQAEFDNKFVKSFLTNSRSTNNLVYDPEEEFKCKSLVKLEEKEYLDQFITTTTTVRTKIKDDLYLLFDNNFFENENHSEDQLNDYFEMKNKADKNSFNRNEKMSNKKSPKSININKNVYSCLNNYFSYLSLV